MLWSPERDQELKKQVNSMKDNGQVYESQKQFAEDVHKLLSFKNETTAWGVLVRIRKLVIFKSTVCKQWKFYQKKTHLLHPLTSKRKKKQICFVFCLQKKNKKKRNSSIQIRERASEGSFSGQIFESPFHVFPLLPDFKIFQNNFSE